MWRSFIALQSRNVLQVADLQPELTHSQSIQSASELRCFKHCNNRDQSRGVHRSVHLEIKLHFSSVWIIHFKNVLHQIKIHQRKNESTCSSFTSSHLQHQTCFQSCVCFALSLSHLTKRADGGDHPVSVATNSAQTKTK